MLAIRLLRIGKKNQPSFKIVVTEKTNPPTAGRFVEDVGFYNPLTKDRNLKAERILYWISKGAQPSDTVHNMLVKASIIEGVAIAKHNPPKKTEETKDATQTAPVVSATPTATATESSTKERAVKETEAEQTREPAEESKTVELVNKEKKIQEESLAPAQPSKISSVNNQDAPVEQKKKDSPQVA